MGSVLVAATFATAVLAVSPALVAAQEAEGAQAKQARPRGGAVTRVEQPDSSGAVSQAERRRPPAAAVVDASASDDQAANDGQRRGAVRRPPSGSSSGGSSDGSSSSSSESGWNRAVPRHSDPDPPRRVYYYPNYGYYNHYYDPWGYGTFGLGYFYYSPWGYGPGYWGPSYSGYGGYSPRGYDMGKVKLKVKARDAEVLVDGYYAGTVDDFDGVFQALTLDSGAYKIEIRKPGYESLHFDVHVQPDRTITYRGEMKAIP